MGVAFSRKLDEQHRVHRVLNSIISRSSYIDPRHLEHYTYPSWTTTAAMFILRHALPNGSSFIVAPQFPIYTSPRDLLNHILGTMPDPNVSVDPDLSDVINISTVTVPDKTARSVFVDVAIMTPVPVPRRGLKLKVKPQHQKPTSVYDVLSNKALNPRYLDVDELLAPILIELKPGPTRHPKDLDTFLTAVMFRLRAAQQQATEQSFCLFASWRFASQIIVSTLR